VGVAFAATLAACAAAVQPAGAASAGTVDPDAPGLEYPVEDLNTPVEDLHFPSGTVSGGVEEDGRKFTLSGQVLFQKDSAKLTSKADAELAELVKRLKAQKPRTLKVDGYTDNVQGKVDNTKLSRDRASTIAAKLKKAFPKAKVTSAGHGDANPIGDNGTEKGKQLNRRVEVRAN
jgi:outer membrane protein OmpA-like peptidoglycan-associated protein